MTSGPSIVVGVRGEAGEDEVNRLIGAGAGELFVGYVPGWWSDRFGFELSPNRRYRRPSQLTTRDRLAGICRVAKARGVPVIVTLNEHFTTPAMWELEQRLIAEALDAGVQGAVVADPSIIGPLRARGLSRIHVSGEAGVYNRAFVEVLIAEGVSRVIFPRELSLADIDRLARRTAAAGLESEVFAMGEPCVFDGARCFAEHGYGFAKDFCNDHLVKLVRRRTSGTESPVKSVALDQVASGPSVLELGKCGLCSLPALLAAGVTHLKVPGRASMAEKGVRLLRAALQALESGPADLPALLGEPGLCASGGFCYHPEVRRGV